MRFAWLVIVVFVARFVTDAVAYPPGDGDLAWQRWLGMRILAAHAIPRSLGTETFTAPGAPSTPQEWFFSIGVALARQGGDAGWLVFATGVALACGLALVLVGLTAVRLGASPVWAAFGTALAGISIIESFGVRAQVAAWPLVAALLFALQARGRGLWWIVPLTALWSNLHASVLLAPVVVLVAAFGQWCDDGFVGSAEARRLVLVAAASLVATCLNPFGVGLPLYAFHLFGDSALRSLINEWQPTTIEETSFALGAFVLFLTAVVSGVGPGTRQRDVFVLWAFTFLMLGAVRNVGIFGIAAAPLAASGLTARIRAAFPETRVAAERPPRAKLAENVLMPLFAVTLAVVVAVVMLSRLEKHPDRGIEVADALLARTPGERVLCEDFAWCSFFLASGTRDFLDGRADPFPDAVWSEYGKVLRLSPGWDGVLDRYGVDAVLVHRDGPLDQALALAGGWRSVERDKKYDLLVRPAMATAQPPVAATQSPTAAGSRLPSP